VLTEALGSKELGSRDKRDEESCEPWHTAPASCLDAVWLPRLSHFASGHILHLVRVEVTLICPVTTTAPSRPYGPYHDNY